MLLDKHAPQHTVLRCLRPQSHGTTPTVNRQRKESAGLIRSTAVDGCQASIVYGTMRLLAIIYYSNKNSRAAGYRKLTVLPGVSWADFIQPANCNGVYDRILHSKAVLTGLQGQSRQDTPNPAFASRCESLLVSYQPVTTDEVRQLLSHAPSKQCSLDPVTTWLLKALTNTVPDVIARFINVSLQSSIFPSSQQHALVKPVLKKQQLDPTDPSSY